MKFVEPDTESILTEHFDKHGYYFLKDGVIIARVVENKKDRTFFDIEIPRYLPDFIHHCKGGPFESIAHAKFYCELFAEKIDFRVHLHYRKRRTLLGLFKKTPKPSFP